MKSGINTKSEVKEFWEQDACGKKLYLDSLDKTSFARHALMRYKLEPYILDFAEFNRYCGKKVLELGVGLGADHLYFAENGADCSGIDLSVRAVELTARHLRLNKLSSNLAVGDADQLDFPDNTFDLVWSWGVIHHSPNIPKAASEILRVLKPGGEFKVMIYHKYSMVGLMLWCRYALLTLKPWMALHDVYARHLESPGTKAYSIVEARRLFPDVDDLEMRVELTHGDLLASSAGQRHQGMMLSIARLVWPHWLIKRLLSNLSLFLLLSGDKLGMTGNGMQSN